MSLIIRNAKCKNWLFQLLGIIGSVSGELAGGEFKRGFFQSFVARAYKDAKEGQGGFWDKFNHGAKMIRKDFRNTLVKAWNSPNTVIGLAFGGVGYAFGIFKNRPTISQGHNSIQLHSNPLVPTGVILGNRVSYGSDPRYHERAIGGHEEPHTYQGELLGPLCLPSNLLGLLLGLLINGNTHSPINWNEVGPQKIPPSPW